MYTSSITPSSTLESEVAELTDSEKRDVIIFTSVLVAAILLAYVGGAIVFCCEIRTGAKNRKKSSGTQQASAKGRKAASAVPKTGKTGTSAAPKAGTSVAPKTGTSVAPKTETTAPKTVSGADKKKAVNLSQVHDIEMSDFGTPESNNPPSKSQSPPPYTPIE